MKTLLATLFFCINAFAEEKKFTMEQVSKHQNAQDCWIVIRSQVYDITSYIPKHPVPQKILMAYCGKNADQGWDTKDKKKPRTHSKMAKELLEQFHIGSL